MSRAPFLLALYEEALDLAQQARDALPLVDHKDVTPCLNAHERLLLTTQGMHLTAQILQCVAWLMGRRAVLDGEISAQEALAPQYRLEGHANSLAMARLPRDRMPLVMMDLTDRAQSLYERIHRLDQELDDDKGHRNKTIHALHRQLHEQMAE